MGIRENAQEIRQAILLMSLDTLKGQWPKRLELDCGFNGNVQVMSLLVITHLE